MSYLVSVCIPTYNGARNLRATLDSLFAQNQAGMEVVVCDDGSTDSTWQIASDYAARHSNLKVFRNEANLGMDLNFREAALHASAPFAWLSGQDDLFDPGVVARVLEILRSEPNLGVLYLNYSQLSHDLSQVICPSILHTQAFHPEKIQPGTDLVFRAPHTSRDYFAEFSAVPSFLPATIFRRQYWVDTDTKPFEGTAYIQVGVICLNMNRHDFYVVTKPMIRGRIPLDGWQSKGQSYFSIMLGSFAAEAIIFAHPQNPFPFDLFDARRKKFTRNFFALVRQGKNMGMRPTARHRQHLRAIYGSGLPYLFFALPLLYSPRGALNALHMAYRRLRDHLITVRANGL